MTWTLVAEGDSWFDFQVSADIVTVLGDFGDDVKSVADPGHTLKDMARTKEQHKEFKKALKDLAKLKTVPAAVLLSGGGNDFVKKLGSLLRPYNPGAAALDQAKVKTFIKKLQSNYNMWLDFVMDACEMVFSKNIPVFVHGYAYVVPNGEPDAFTQGPWLRPAFENQGHTNLAQNTKTMRTLIDQFNSMLEGLANRRKHVHYVNLREELTDNDWFDELHPAPDGVRRIVIKFRSEIERVV